jgi:uncharacterized membrane protein
MNDPGPYYRPPGMGYGYGPRPRRFRWLPIVIGAILAGVAAFLLLILLYPTWFGLSPASSPYRFGLGGPFLVFFVLIVVFFIVRVAFWSTRASRYGRRYDGGSPGEYGRNRPAMIARMRYARGEITREQYDQIMKDLGRRPGSP